MQSEGTHAVQLSMYPRNGASRRGSSAPADPSRMRGNSRRERRSSTEKRRSVIVPELIVSESCTAVRARGRAAPDGCPVAAEGGQQQQAVEGGGAAVCPSPTYVSALRAREGSFRTPRNRDRARNEKATPALQDVLPEPEELLLQSAPRPAPDERISLCNASVQSHVSRREHPKLCSLVSVLDTACVIPDALHQHEISSLPEAAVEVVSLEEAPGAAPAETTSSVVADCFGRPSSAASIAAQGTPSPCAGDAGCIFERPGSDTGGGSNATLVERSACPEEESGSEACLLQPFPDGKHDVEFHRPSRDSACGISGQLHVVVDSDDGTTPTTSVTALDETSSYHSLSMAKPGDSPTSLLVRSQICSELADPSGAESVSKLTREIVLRAGLHADSTNPLFGHNPPDISAGCSALICVQRGDNRVGSSDEVASKYSQERQLSGTSSQCIAQKLTAQPRELIAAPTLSRPASKVSHRSQGSRQTSRRRTIAPTPSPASSSRSDNVARLAQLPEHQQVTGQAASKPRSTKSRENHPMGESPQVVRVALDETVRGIRQNLQSTSSASHSRDLPWTRPSGSSRSDVARKLASSLVTG